MESGRWEALAPSPTFLKKIDWLWRESPLKYLVSPNPPPPPSPSFPPSVLTHCSLKCPSKKSRSCRAQVPFSNSVQKRCVHINAPQVTVPSPDSKCEQSQEPMGSWQSLICWLDTEYSGAPNDSSLWNICSEKQILPRIFYYFRTAKNF